MRPTPVDPGSVTIDTIRAARSRIEGVLIRTPFTKSFTLSSIVGAEVFLKFENLQYTGSFKGRGAEYFTHVHKGSARRPWACASAGNFGQGLAYAARKQAIPLIVYAATTANCLSS